MNYFNTSPNPSPSLSFILAFYEPTAKVASENDRLHSRRILLSTVKFIPPSLVLSIL